MDFDDAEGPDTSYTTLEGVPYVRLVPEEGPSPVWAWEAIGYDVLSPAPELERRLRRWHETHLAEGSGGAGTTAGGGTSAVLQRLRAEGILIAQELAAHLGSPLAVEFGAADPSWDPDAAAHQAGGSPWEAGSGWDGADGEGRRPSLMDPALFHARTFPADPAASRRIAWMLSHPYESPDHGAAPDGAEEDWD
ncbi:hypothetical protein ACQ3I4_01700 [Zafaria sp. Z1313]|uniref:hypothetical protein n=1 Tax=Zafaria sp. Z1313 TaxID=3423202 RepID=UPI003D302EA0